MATSQYDASMTTVSNQSSYPIGTKTQLFVSLPIDAICEIW